MSFLKQIILLNLRKPKNVSGQLVSCSGFFIDKNGYVVTNSHVIDGCKNDKN